MMTIMMMIGLMMMMMMMMMMIDDNYISAIYHAYKAYKVTFHTIVHYISAPSLNYVSVCSDECLLSKIKCTFKPTSTDRYSGGSRISRGGALPLLPPSPPLPSPPLSSRYFLQTLGGIYMSEPQPTNDLVHI